MELSFCVFCRSFTLQLPNLELFLDRFFRTIAAENLQGIQSLRTSACFLSRQHQSQSAVVKGAVRAHKRRRLEDLADGLEQGVSCNQVRTTKVMVERLAPVPMPPRVPVRQKAGSPTWDHDGEIDARTDALVNIFGAEPLLFDTESQIQPSQALDSFAAGALRTKDGTEERLLNYGRQRWDSVHMLHCRHVPSLPSSGK